MAEYKILEQNGVENENVDGAEFNKFCAHGQDGIIQGVLDECTVTQPSSNSITISTGEIIVHGFRIKLTSPLNFSFSTYPDIPTRYQVIVHIDLKINRDVDVQVLYQPVADLQRANLFQSEQGIYEAEILRFTHDLDGSLTDIVRTMDVISNKGGGGSGGGEFVVGNVTTKTLAAGLDAEVDVESRQDVGGQWVTDFTFSIPQGERGPKGDTPTEALINENGELIITYDTTTKNLNRVQGGGFFGSTSDSDTSIPKTTVQTNGVSPLVGDTIVNANGDLCKVTATTSTAYTVTKYNSIKGVGTSVYVNKELRESANFVAEPENLHGFFTGDGAPTTVDGAEIGDFYLDKKTGSVYRKDYDHSPTTIPSGVLRFNDRLTGAMPSPNYIAFGSPYPRIFTNDEYSDQQVVNINTSSTSGLYLQYRLYVTAGAPTPLNVYSFETRTWINRTYQNLSVIAPYSLSAELADWFAKNTDLLSKNWTLIYSSNKENLIFNSHFDINQRNITEVVSRSDLQKPYYFLDRWAVHATIVSTSNFTVRALTENGETLIDIDNLKGGNTCLVCQFLEKSAVKLNTTYTAICKSNGITKTFTFKTPETYPNSLTEIIPTDNNNTYFRFAYDTRGGGCWCYGFYVTAGNFVRVSPCCGLYEGEVAPEPPRPDVTIELLRCQRYYVSIPYMMTIGWVSTAEYCISTPLPVTMRVTPTIVGGRYIARTLKGYSAHTDSFTSYKNFTSVRIESHECPTGYRIFDTLSAAVDTGINNTPMIFEVKNLVLDAEM